jgi:hypothetical protein
VCQGIVSAFKWAEFLSYGMSYIVLRGRRCDIIVMRAHAQTQEIKTSEMRMASGKYGKQQGCMQSFR